MRQFLKAAFLGGMLCSVPFAAGLPADRPDCVEQAAQ